MHIHDTFECRATDLVPNFFFFFNIHIPNYYTVAFELYLLQFRKPNKTLMSAANAYVSNLQKIKPLRQKTNQLKQQVMEHMQKQKLDSLQVDGKTIRLVTRSVSKSLSHRMLHTELDQYTDFDDDDKQRFRDFLTHVKQQQKQNSTKKVSLQYK